jgi:hypothetical protein
MPTGFGCGAKLGRQKKIWVKTKKMCGKNVLVITVNLI